MDRKRRIMGKGLLRESSATGRDPAVELLNGIEDRKPGSVFGMGEDLYLLAL